MAVNGSLRSHSTSNVNDLEESPRVLSIQSHVVHGYVGNKSATFPLQVLGFDVDAINTVQFSNHTHYKHTKGPILSNSDLSDLIEGLSLNDIDHFTHLLTGYSRDPASLKQVANIIKKLREKNPNLIYVCDPVMGDNGRMYVPETILPVYRDIITPLADIITPNQFEAELLTGIKIGSISDAWRAVHCLHSRGTKVVILSSTELGENNGILGLASIAQGACYTINIPKLPAFFIGTGDLFAALMLAWTYKTNNDIKFSLEKTIATMQQILNDTYRYAKAKCGDGEMTSDKVELRLIQNKSAIENPQVVIKAVLTNSQE